jgi:hypothetical protein
LRNSSPNDRKWRTLTSDVQRALEEGPIDERGNVQPNRKTLIGQVGSLNGQN